MTSSATLALQSACYGSRIAPRHKARNMEVGGRDEVDTVRPRDGAASGPKTLIQELIR
ncbi:MAG TPA: hypothetical protein VH678_22975 [Xanthobacteraceae bacterium]